METVRYFLFFSLLSIILDCAAPQKAIDTPAICLSTFEVFDSFKTLCQPKTKALTYNAAETFCKKHRMQLCDVKSPPSTESSLIEFLKTLFKGSKKARVYVQGRTVMKCLTYSGDGNPIYVPCVKSFLPICEFYINPKTVSCRSREEREFLDTALESQVLADFCLLNPIRFSRTDVSFRSDDLKTTGIEISPSKVESFLPVSLEENFPNLGYLFAKNCKISIIAPINFKGLSKLRELDLSSNDIEQVYDGTFQDLISLENLNLNSNKIARIRANAFSGLSNLKLLELSRNSIQAIMVGSFKDLSSLIELHLSFNKIRMIQAGTFNGLSVLENLNLFSNKIETINRDIFKGLKNLKQLSLDNNSIKIIPTGTFNNFTLLEYLSLSKNVIEIITKETFEGMQSLQELNLSTNFIRKIGFQTFTDLLSISSVNLLKNVCVDSEFVQPAIEELPGTWAPKCGD